MTIAELQQHLLIHHQSFNKSMGFLNEECFVESKEGKWSAGQHLEHIVRSTAPVLLAFQLPTFITRLLFGKAERGSDSYIVLVKKYIACLESGGRASGRFIPGFVVYSDRDRLITRLTNIINKLIARLNHFSEHDLDRILLPHPLLGKITYREMILFTIYHVQHHQKVLN